MKERVTQRDIAKQAGVSHVTVSLALRGHSSISQSTQKRIRNIAASIGYVPDPMLSALASYRKIHRPSAYQANIAWINNFGRPEDLYAGDFGEYYKGVVARSRELGFLLEEYRIEDVGQDWKYLKRLLQDKGVKAIVLAPSAIPNRRFELDLTEFTAVRLGFSYAYPPINTVVNNHFASVAMCMKQLLQRGYHRVGFVLDSDVHARTSSRFYGGYVACQQALPKKQHIAPLLLPTGKDPRHAMAHWARSNRVDCIISFRRQERYLQLLEAGLDMPGSVGYADLSLLEDEASLCGVCQNSRQVGIFAIDLIVSMLHHQQTGIPKACVTMLADGYWIEGHTTRPIENPPPTPET